MRLRFPSLPLKGQSSALRRRLSEESAEVEDSAWLEGKRSLCIARSTEAERG